MRARLAAPGLRHAAFPVEFRAALCAACAVGDIHGDLQKALMCLELAGVLEEQDGHIHWVGGDTTVVQLGDVLDRGDSEIGGCWAGPAWGARVGWTSGGGHASRPWSGPASCRGAIVRQPAPRAARPPRWLHLSLTAWCPCPRGAAATVLLLRELDRQARQEGGAVWMLNGNHESLNIAGDFRWVRGRAAGLPVIGGGERSVAGRRPNGDKNRAPCADVRSRAPLTPRRPAPPACAAGMSPRVPSGSRRWRTA